MKYCENCGAQLDDDARFCKKCGVFFDDAENGADSAEAQEGTKETVQPVPANESQENQNTAEASASEQTSEPGDGDKPPADKKSGYIGCIVLIFFVVVLFKGCGMLFGGSSYWGPKYSDMQPSDDEYGMLMYTAIQWECKSCGQIFNTGEYFAESPKAAEIGASMGPRMRAKQDKGCSQSANGQHHWEKICQRTWQNFRYNDYKKKGNKKTRWQSTSKIGEPKA